LRRPTQPAQAGATENSPKLKVAGFGRSGGQPARSESILNSFCILCYLCEQELQTVDPRTAFPVRPNVLDTPSLIDGSESPSEDETQGAAADVSTASFQFGPGETVSDASQLAVTVEGYKCSINFLCPSPFPCTDTGSKDDLPEASIDTSQSSSRTTSDTFYLSPTSSSDIRSPPTTVSPRARPPLSYIASASNSTFDLQPSRSSLSCLHCPRTFKTQQDLE